MRTLLLCALFAAGPAAAAAPTAHDLAALGYDALGEGERDRAAQPFEEALALTGNSARRRRLAMQLGYLHVQLKRPERAAAFFAHAVAIRPDAEGFRALGYAHLAAGDTARATIAFRESLAYGLSDSLVHRQLGYLEKQAGRLGRAAHHFRAAIDAADRDGEADPARRLLVRREVRAAERRLFGGVTILSRADSDTGSLVLGERILSRSQGTADINVKLPLPLGRGRWLAAFGRMLWALDESRPTLIDRSAQGGAGLKLKPFAGQSAIIAVERLLSVGDFARDDWLARAAWSTGAGFEAPPVGADWPVWSLYGDVAVIGLDETDLLAQVQGRAGWAFRAGPAYLTPHILMNGLLQDADAGTETLLEAGPGLALTLPLKGDRYRASAVSLELAAHYRIELAGNSGNEGGPTLRVSLRF